MSAATQACRVGGLMPISPSPLAVREVNRRVWVSVSSLRWGDLGAGGAVHGYVFIVLSLCCSTPDPPLLTMTSLPINSSHSKD